MTRALKELKDTIVPAEAYQLLMDNVQSVDAKTFCQQRMRETRMVFYTISSIRILRLLEKKTELQGISCA